MTLTITCVHDIMQIFLFDLIRQLADIFIKTKTNESIGMDSNEKIIELLQEIRDNQKIQIDSGKKMRSLYIKVVIAASVILGLQYLWYYARF